MTVSRRQALTLSASAALISLLPVPARANGLRIETGAAFGSAWRLALPDTSDALQARRLIENIIYRIDQKMSPFRPDTEVSEFNSEDRSGILLSDETRQVTMAALEIAKASDGAFDPTLAPIARRFGFGSPRIGVERPAGRYQDLSLNGHWLSSKQPGLSLDLCAIAKGFALDQIVAALDGLDFLIELGGEVAARGHHPTGRPWQIGIERPGSPFLQRIIDADSNAVATSSTAVQGYSIGQHLYGHVIDPRTAEPVSIEVASVSVKAPSAMLADGLATASLVMGPEAARAMLAAYQATALFLVHRPEGMDEIDIGGFIGSENQ